jgi:hypothetical protein
MDPPDSPIPSPQTVNKNVLSYNLFDKIRSAYVQKEMASFANTNVRAEISEGDLNKIFINEMERVLNQDPYGKHTKSKFSSASKEDEVYLRFAEVIMFYMWSPLDENTRETIQAEVRDMRKMSNLARVDDVRKFITNNFGSIIHRWAKNEKLDPKKMEYLEIGEICKKCLEKNGLPIIPDKTNDDYSNLDLKLVLKKARSLLIQLDEFGRDSNKVYVSQIRVLLERFYKMYYKYLRTIPSYKKLFNNVYEGKVSTGFRLYKEDPKRFRDFSGKKFVTIRELLFYSQKAIQANSHYGNLHEIYPNVSLSKIKNIMDILNSSSHSGPFDYDMIQFKKDTKSFINNLIRLKLLPSTVVFYRLEKDAFGIHYKGNTLDGKVFVMLSQEGEEYELGKFYLVTSITYPAYLVGYAASA